MPLKLKQAYIMPKNQKLDLECLDNNFSYLGEKSKETYMTVLKALAKEVDAGIIGHLEEQAKEYFSKETQSFFYYVLFCWIFSAEIRSKQENAPVFNVDTTLTKLLSGEPVIGIDQKLKEFDREILMTYAVSGKSGNMVIQQLAELGETDNPYIYMEAAELEINKYHYIKREEKFAKRNLRNYVEDFLDKNKIVKEPKLMNQFVNGFIDNIARTDEPQAAIYKAYKYYEKASKLGHPLATWSLGYLFYKSAKDSWPVPTGEVLDINEKYKKAVFFFQEALKGNCSKAYNSLGNIVSREDVNYEIKQGLHTTEEYYKRAAEEENVFGMYNYARELEKKLNKPNANDLENKKEVFMTMLNYYQKAANNGHYKACYRYALYKGYLEDNDTIKDYQNTYCICNKEDKNLSFQYLVKAIRADQTIEYDERCYDAYIYWLQYTILDNKGCASKEKIKIYLNLLKEEYLSGRNIPKEKKYFFEKQVDIIRRVESELGRTEQY